MRVDRVRSKAVTSTPDDVISRSGSEMMLKVQVQDIHALLVAVFGACVMCIGEPDRRRGSTGKGVIPCPHDASDGRCQLILDQNVTRQPYALRGRQLK